MGTTTRIFNFAAGPAVLPLPVLEEAQRDLVSLPGVGMSVLEISHRSKTFEAIIQECEANIRKLAGIPEGYYVLFLQGGATLQFSMVPLTCSRRGRRPITSSPVRGPRRPSRRPRRSERSTPPSQPNRRTLRAFPGRMS